MEEILQMLLERIYTEYPEYGTMEIKLVFHCGNLESYEFSKTEKTLIKNKANF